jgi:hypothetical protein
MLADDAEDTRLGRRALFSSLLYYAYPKRKKDHLQIRFFARRRGARVDMVQAVVYTFTRRAIGKELIVV